MNRYKQEKFMRNAKKMFAILAMFVLVASVAAGKQSKSGASSPEYSVGIMPFEDLSGGENSENIKQVLSKKLQAALLSGSSFSPKMLKYGGDNPEDVSADIAYAVKLGRHYKTDLVVMGSLLSLDVEEGQSGLSSRSIGGFSLGGNARSQTATVILQAELIDVARGKKITSFRVTGKSRQGKFSPNVGSDYGSIDVSDANFGSTSLGKATEQAVEQLAARVVAATSQFTPSGEGSGDGDGGGEASSSSSGCAAMFRVLGSDMAPISTYEVGVDGTDMTAQVKDGVLQLKSSSSSPVIQVKVKGAKKPLYAGKIEGPCAPDRVFVLEIDDSGEGKFSWWQ
jgi:TolB-like protein